ncbi:MAG TPA: hypothetical protein VEV17_20530 [Bryobacteraceae bacterium]|nr:hypothetical protein [Bryobacteraceae bacterium]
MQSIQAVAWAAAFLAAGQVAEAQTIFNPAPSHIAGQAVLQQIGLLTATAPNLVEGRELDSPQALAIDTSSNPPILYVADTLNNRVLAWQNAFGFSKGDPASMVIGQRDLLTTAPQGPGAGLSTGLFHPVAVATDASGNLYVSDAGNNRILRYPAPFAQSGDILQVDLVLGQPDLNSRAPNHSQSAPSARTLAFATSSGIFRAGLAFDSQGNLWVSDPANNRVLRFPAGALQSGAANQPAADLVLGQPDFVSNVLPPNIDRSKKNFLSAPSGLAFDPKGRLFVADGASRVAVYFPPFAAGQLSSRLLGVVIPSPGQPTPVINESTLGGLDSDGRAIPPEGVFFIGGNPYVVDTGNARILGYDPIEQWPDEAKAFSPPARVVLGQPNFVSNLSNQNLAQPNAFTLAGPLPNPSVGGPVAAAFAGSDLFVVDSGNHRLLVFPQQPGGGFSSANRLLGQIDFRYNSPNFIEGREVGFAPNSGSCIANGAPAFLTGGSAIIDPSSDPPHLYVADPLNNRVLGFADYRKVNAGAKADLVLGQPDLFTGILNYPTNNPTQANDAGLWSPEGLAVDSAGNLYVADACNARVLRFAAPFNQPPAVIQRANLVLGQTGFFGQPVKDLSRQTMRSAYGLAFTADGDLVVSDPLANRILFFRKPPGGDFQPGQPASNVFGQRDFSSSFSTVFSGPRLISVDAGDQLYVADSGNNRIAVLPNVPAAGDNPPVLFAIAPLSNPSGVFVNQATGEIWVTNTGANQVLRYPNFQTVISNPAPSATLGVFGAVSVALDPFGNPVVAEGLTNRVSFYFPAIDYTTSAGGVSGRLSGNAANFFGRFAPGMLASLFPFANASFGVQTASAGTTPWPTTLGDVQVLVGGLAAPLTMASPAEINLQVPSATPVGSFVEFQVVRASTGQVLASWLFRVDAASPGLFTASGSGAGQLLAMNNEDQTMNNGAHPAQAGSTITLYGTGPGAIDGMPPDGDAAPAAIATPQTPKVFINSDFVPDSDVQFSGLAPGMVGVWQITVKIPANVPPADVIVYVTYDGINSILDPNGIRRITTIRTTP